MKKMLLSAALFAVTALSAQTQLNNSGLENWDGNTEPTNWNGFETADGTFSGATEDQLDESTDVRPGTTGTKSARIWTRSALFGIKANGNLTTGRVSAGSATATGADNYNRSLAGNQDFHHVFTDTPDSIIVWVKYTPIDGADSAKVRATIHDNGDYIHHSDPGNDDATNRGMVVADAISAIYNNAGAWQRLSIPFVYTANTDAQFILISISSNYEAGGGTAGDELLIDDIELIYNPAPVEVSTVSADAASYYISSSMGNSIDVSYTTTTDFNGGNIFTAELSDENGSFTNPVVLGTSNAITSGTISGTIPAGTITGTGYRVRVIADDPSYTSNDNGTDISITLITNSIAPVAQQNIETNAAGDELTVTENFGGTREWKYSTTQGTGYLSFNPMESNNTYTPLFGAAGTYYVVCESSIDGITVISNEVIVAVTDPVTSSQILTASADAALYVISTDQSTTIDVSYTIQGAFDAMNIFTAQLSDASGSFLAPTVLGTLISNADGTILANIPAGTAAGTGYRVRVVSDNPAATSPDNGSDIEIVLVDAIVSPSTDQTIAQDTDGTELAFTSAITPDAVEWKYSTTQGTGYVSFNPTETNNTYTPNFSAVGTFYVVCEVTYQNVTATSNEVMITVTDFSSAADYNANPLHVFSNNNFINVENVTSTTNATLYDLSGKVISTLNNKTTDFIIEVTSGTGVYLLHTDVNGKQEVHKVIIQ